ncbi:hypothetical protein AB0L49_03225 [Streptomyces antimycoticus]|uniref:hypothetical protein n=1 Tax=Streptomyces antimycoticus TaxID=68175 RepID=UPI00343E7FFB
MDAALLAVATSSANALVSLMTTDIWERAKTGVSKIYSRLSKSSEAIERELEDSRVELSNSVERGDPEETAAEMRQLWRGKFRRLLIDHPDAETELNGIITLWCETSAPSGLGSGNVIHQDATANDNSRIYQQGSGIQYNN